MIRMRVAAITLAAFSLLVLTVPAMGQLTRWCPAGDGDVIVGVPLGNRSYDLNFNGVVNIVDFAMFAASYPSPPVPYSLCVDYAAPFGLITLVDFATFASHYLHAGPVIGLCS